MNLKNLKRSLERAEVYLGIVRKIENGVFTIEELEYIQANAGILQKEMQKLGHGIIFLKAPFNLGIFPNYPIIANFPTMIATRKLEREGLSLIPTYLSLIPTYCKANIIRIENNRKT